MKRKEGIETIRVRIINLIFIFCRKSSVSVQDEVNEEVKGGEEEEIAMYRQKSKK